MDKNQVIGLAAIGAILLGWSWWMTPSAEELALKKQKQDSIALVQEQLEDKANQALTVPQEEKQVVDTLIHQSDSVKLAEAASLYGDFSRAAVEDEVFKTIETDLLKVRFSSKGGRMVSAELKDYSTYSGKPLLLFSEDSSMFNYDFPFGNRLIPTRDLNFSSQVISTDTTKELRFTLTGDNGRRFTQVYGFASGSYMVDYSIETAGMDDMLRNSNNELAFTWSMYSPSKEKGMQQERATTSAYWKEKDGNVDYINESRYSEENEFETPLKWIGFKQQFFSVVLIAENHFASKGTQVQTLSTEGSLDYVEAFQSRTMIPLANNMASMRFFLGPHKYSLVTQYDLDLDEQINLGWGIFGWVNKYIVIQVFDFLELFNMNYGIIILILTIAVKLALFPITYKTYLSSARTKVLKPEMDALNEKFKDEDPMKKQQATMKLYQEAGVNPMAGCIPMLIQMPILYAMFRFFPASIELRGQSFLWAEDLSTYDSVYQLPFDIPFYGDHVSLFTLFMAVSTFLYTRYNSSMSMPSGPQAQQMKIIMYFMPIMLLGFFNNYSSGLSFYYFSANIITIVQQLVIKKFFINEEAIHAKIQANIANPDKKKSRFQKQMDAAMKKQKRK